MENNSKQKTKINKQITYKDDSYLINNCNTSGSKNKIKIQKKLNNSFDEDERKKEEKKEDVNDDSVVPVRSMKRMNSIKLYKKHKKEKERRITFNRSNDKDSKDKTGDLINLSNATGTKRTSKISKNMKQKKVNFLPNFVKVIYVESYKKFNAENTCKDPFENMEIVNGHINIKNNNDDDEADGKTKVLCSCTIY